LTESAELSDAVLVRRILTGETDLYGILVERYRIEFGRYASAMLGGNRDDAADALQEAFIRAFDSLGSLGDPGRFKAWLFRIVSNQCHNVRKRNKPHLSLEGIDDPAAVPAERQIANREIGEAIEEAIGQLTPEQREAFVMKHVEGRSYAEMSELLGVGQDALKMRVHRARDELKRLLEGML
jgi:RNA polymerase sigma-70 factor (ECF subfamily)